jgi:hypothetical protein
MGNEKKNFFSKYIFCVSIGILAEGLAIFNCPVGNNVIPIRFSECIRLKKEKKNYQERKKN